MGGLSRGIEGGEGCMLFGMSSGVALDCFKPHFSFG